VLVVITAAAGVRLTANTAPARQEVPA
jgi:hypothetical protein